MPCYALPFCHLEIKALRSPYPNRWDCTRTAPLNPETLGEHLKCRRLGLHLMQAELADRLGVHVESLKNWERGATCPTVRHVPKILEFLGYNPEQKPESQAQRIIYTRRQLGLTQKQLAKRLAVDAVTLYRW